MFFPSVEANRKFYSKDNSNVWMWEVYKSSLEFVKNHIDLCGSRVTKTVFYVFFYNFFALNLNGDFFMSMVYGLLGSCVFFVGLF